MQMRLWSRQWLGSRLMDLIRGYGEMPMRVIGFSLSIILISGQNIRFTFKAHFDLANAKNLAQRIYNRSVDEILDSGRTILEPEIVDTLLELETEMLLIGQAKGKFGGGARRVFKQTQKKTKEGNKPSFASNAVVGNQNGLVGVGYGKSKETVPAREKAIRNAKKNIFKMQVFNSFFIARYLLLPSTKSTIRRGVC